MILSSLLRPRALRAGLALAAALAALLAACGGGTTPIQAFKPGRVLAFGDEMNVLSADGKRYAVNGLDANKVFDCALLPIMAQSLAAAYGFVFEPCKGTQTEFKAVSRAGVGAQADDVAAQVDAQINAGGFKPDDLATMLVGVNDVLALYAQFAIQGEGDLTKELEARGKRLAQQVNRLVGLGPRVIVITIPDVSYSPYAKAEALAHTDTDRRALLARLVYAYNASIRLNILNDGRYIALVLGDEQVQAMNVSPASFSLTNVADAACTTALPDCTADTLVTGATVTSHLWADDRHPGATWHSQVASLAAARARSNPF